MNRNHLMALVAIAAVSGCAAPTASVTAGGNQAELRQIQTREYRTTDRRSTMRSVVATLQDLGFVIDEADFDLGLLTATRFETATGPRLLDKVVRVTVTVSEQSGDRLAVRANARMGEQTIEDAEAYQDFFAALDKSLFLAANQVN